MIARKKAMAAAVRNRPMVAIVTSATTHRTAGKNTIIFRTHKKRLRSGLSITAAAIRKIAKDHQDEREAAIDGDRTSIAVYLSYVGADMVKELAAKVTAKGLVDTGALRDSLKLEVRNV